MTKKVIDDGLRNLSLDIVSAHSWGAGARHLRARRFFKEPEPNYQEPESFFLKPESGVGQKEGSFGLPNTDCQLLINFFGLIRC